MILHDDFFKDISGRRSIMTDGEGRERFQYMESREVRVPVAVLYRAHGHGQADEDEGCTWGPDGSEGSDSSETRGSADGGGDAPAPDGASEEQEQEQQPYPALSPVVFFCIKQTTRPRSWCLRVVCNPYPFVFFPPAVKFSPASFRWKSTLSIPSADYIMCFVWKNSTYKASFFLCTLNDTLSHDLMAWLCYSEISYLYSGIRKASVLKIPTCSVL